MNVVFPIVGKPGEPKVAHHNADGTVKHYCSASYCPDIHGEKAEGVRTIRLGELVGPVCFVERPK